MVVTVVYTPLFISLGIFVVSHTFTYDGDGDTSIIYWFYTCLTCVRVEPAQPTPSTTPPFPCETHPAQRPSITPVENPTQGAPLFLGLVIKTD